MTRKIAIRRATNSLLRQNETSRLARLNRKQSPILAIPGTVLSRASLILVVAALVSLGLASCGGGGGGGNGGDRGGTVVMPPGNRAPIVEQRLADINLILEVGRPFRWQSPLPVTAYFSDPDGDALTYRVSTSNVSVADAGVGTAPRTVIVEATGGGAATITVSATDGSGLSASLQFRVTVEDRRSTTSTDDHGDTRAEATSLALGGSRSGSLERAGDTDFFGVTLAESGTLSVYTTGTLDTLGELQDGNGQRIAANDDSGAGQNFRIEHQNAGPGTYYIKVTGFQNATGSYTVFASYTRNPATPSNRAPVVRERIPDLTDTENTHPQEDIRNWLFVLSQHFSDPDGDTLTYSVRSTNPFSAPVRIEFEDSLFVTEGLAGVSTITVTARDPGGLTASLEFTVTIQQPSNRNPVVAAEITDVNRMDVGDRILIFLANHFSDPDGDTLTYSASSNAPQFVQVSVSGNELTFTAVQAFDTGAVTVTVTARDPHGATVQDTFVIRSVTGSRLYGALSANWKDPGRSCAWAAGFAVRGDRNEARTAAVNGCRQNGGHNCGGAVSQFGSAYRSGSECAALAFGQSGSRCRLKVAFGSTRSAAESAALADCRSGGFNCSVLRNSRGERMSVCAE